MVDPDRTLKQKVYRGMKEYLYISLYLWIIFSLFVLYRTVLSSEHGIPYMAHGVALVNALALGKIMLVAQELKFADRFKTQPLIYPTLFKSVSFALVLGCFKAIEEAVIGLFHGHSLRESIAELTSGGLLVIGVQIALLAILLIPFFGFTELNRLFGKDKLRKLFFHSRTEVADPNPA